MTTNTRSANESTTAMPTDTGSDVQPMGLKDAATGVADEAGRTLEATTARGMTQVGGVLHQVADAVRQSGESLETERPEVGRFFATAADKLDEAATFMSDRQPSELMDEAQQVARRQPALVIGGGLIAGLLIGRVLRSAGGQSGSGATSGQDWYAAGPGSTGNRTRGMSDVSSGYGTGYGASYDQANASRRQHGNGSADRTGTPSESGSDRAEG